VQAAIRSVLRGVGDVRVTSAGQGYVLTGTVPAAQDAYRAEAVARSFAGEGRQVLNEITVLSSIQVNLRVRVAEVSREVTREFGLNWAAFANSGQWALGFQSFLPIGSALAQPSTASIRYRSSVFDINALIDSLAQDRVISVLAEPNLTAQSGETASFLAGGEFPIPVATTQTGQISIEFKQFGVSLAFVPTVLGPDRLNLRVRPEVSELSQNGAIEVPLGLGGTVRIPAITVRRAETTVELGSGQSFAIAGLLQRATDQTEQGTIGLQDLPVLGALFRSDRFRRAETELVIIVTPYIVRPVSEPARLAAPTDTFRPATDLERIIERRQLGRVRPGASRTLDAGFIVE
jgi:pilus assembly protein CpaC